MRQKPRLRVAVLVGGPSAEHDVSIASGKMILRTLDKKKYQASAVFISRKGRWGMSKREFKKNFDVALIAAMHGEFGEDGKLQKLLEKMKMPYTGSDSRASALGMDKVRSAQRFRRAGIPSPRFVLMRSARQKNPYGFPVVVKPTDRGSSVGVTIVRSARQMPAAYRLARRYSRKVMLQQFIAGREITCGVLAAGRRIALPTTEIRPKVSHFFDYKAKYAKGGSVEVTPAPLSHLLTRQIQSAALDAHKVLGCYGYSRSDFMLAPDGRFYILEINTLPGMTATSLLPQEAAAIGIGFSKLLDILIEQALRKR